MAKTIVVGDRFRTNELSLKPGGHTVTVVYSNGPNRVYQNIKNPELYVRSIVKDLKITSVLVDDQPFWTK